MFVTLGGFKFVVHSPEVLSLVPCRTVMLFLLVIVTFVLVKVTVQSLSQNWLMEINALFLRSGNMCALLALSGSSGISSTNLVANLTETRRL